MICAKDRLKKHRIKKRHGIEAIELLGDGGYEAIRGLADRVAYGGSCPPDAPCRQEAHRVLSLLSLKRHKVWGKWTDYALREMKEMWERGDKVKDICAHFSCSHNAVGKQAYDRGWKRDPRARGWSEEQTAILHDLWSKGVISKQIAAKVGKSASAVWQKAAYDGLRKRCKGTGVRIPDSHVQRAKALRAKGVSWGEISRTLHRSAHGLRKAIERDEGG